MRPLLPAVAAAVLFACSTAPPPPAADTQQRPFPDLGGRTVVLLPLQAVVPLIGLPDDALAGAAEPLGTSARAALEGELGFWLADGATRTRWILPDAVDRAAARSPTLDVHPRDLYVRDFLRARLTSIGDPLYGDLRKLGTLLDARLMLLPVGAVWIPEQSGGGRVHMAAALIDTFGGTVLWYGVVAGTAGARDDPAVAASAAQALARITGR